MTTRTLLPGDWNPWIRDPTDVVPDPKDETRLRHYVGIFVIALANEEAEVG